MTTDAAEPRIGYLTDADCSALGTLMDAVAEGEVRATRAAASRAPNGGDARSRSGAVGFVDLPRDPVAHKAIRCCPERMKPNQSRNKRGR